MFIDARQMGTIKTRVERVFTDEDVAGFCYSAKLDEIEKNGFVPTPGRYGEAADQEKDNEPFDQKLKRLTALLRQQQQGAKLDAAIARNLALLGFAA